jgi:membrane-associated phospholipid phosphatase
MTTRRLATLLAVCALAFLALLAGVLWWRWIDISDLAFNAFLGPHRTSLLLAGFLWLTALGAKPAIVAACIATTGLLWVARLSALILPLWISFLGSEATSWSLKHLVGRARPQFLEVASATSPSFPSGHSIAAMAVYGFLAFVLARHGPQGKLSIMAPLALAALILLIGFSRIFLSVHFVSDVIGGFLIGGCWLLVAIALSLARAPFRDVPPRGQSG